MQAVEASFGAVPALTSLHFWQTALFFNDENVPIGHRSQTALPSLENVPGGQTTQPAAPAARPSIAVLQPSGHVVQIDLKSGPAIVWLSARYMPALHCSQVLETNSSVPSSRSTSKNVPLPHVIQNVEPSLFVQPSGHVVHGALKPFPGVACELLRYLPPRHVSQLPCPTMVVAPPEHGGHAVFVESLKYPGLHGVQRESAVALFLPTMQNLQSPIPNSS